MALTEKEKHILVCRELAAVKEMLNTLPSSTTTFLGLDSTQEKAEWYIAVEIAQMEKSGDKWQPKSFKPSHWGLEDEDTFDYNASNEERDKADKNLRNAFIRELKYNL